MGEVPTQDWETKKSIKTIILQKGKLNIHQAMFKNTSEAPMLEIALSL